MPASCCRRQGPYAGRRPRPNVGVEVWRSLRVRRANGHQSKKRQPDDAPDEQGLVGRTLCVNHVVVEGDRRHLDVGASSAATTIPPCASPAPASAAAAATASCAWWLAAESTSSSGHVEPAV
jgi:hypothetical protein